MSIKLLPASVDPVDASQPEVSTSLVPLTQRAIASRLGQTDVVLHTDAFAWSASARRGEPNRIDGTPVEDSKSDETAGSGWEYVSGWAWSRPVEKTAVAHYLSYAASPASRRGRLIDLYA